MPNPGIFASGVQVGGAFDPLTAVTWAAVYWGNDPNWTPPADGGSVSSWRDASGNARDVTSSGSNQPTFRASVTNLNNRSAVQFDGTDDWLFEASGYTVAQPFTVVSVTSAWVSSAGLNGRMFGSNSGNIQISKGYPGASEVALYAGGADLRGNGSGVDDTSANLVTVRFDGANSAIGINGTVGVVSATPGNAGIATDTIMANRSDGNRPGAVKIAFLGVYSGVFSSDGQYSAFKSWVSSYYGLTIA